MNGFIADLLLLLFPPFLYNVGSVSDRQGHSFSDSRYTSSRESECERLADDGVTAFGSAIKRAYRKVQCLRENSVVRGYPGKVELSFFLLLLGFKAFWRARGTIAGSEGMYAIRKGRLTIRETPPTPTEQCYACVA
jgi:hypothetical protein